MVEVPNPILRVSFQGAIENSAGTGHTLTETAVARIPDADFGECGSFNGTTAKLTVGGMACPQAFTMMAWVKRHPDVNPGVVTLFEFGDNTPLVALNAGRPMFRIPSPTKPGWTKALTSDAVIPATWTHVAVIYANGVAGLYVDGRRVKVYSGYGFTPGTGLGIGHNVGDKFFRGELAEFRIYDQALPGGTIAYLKTMTHPTLAAHKAAADADAAAKKAAADAAAVKEAVVVNLVMPGFDPDHKAPAAKAFYETHGDDYDFLVFISPHAGSAHYFPVRREVCPGLGHTYENGTAPVRNGEAFGSAARLKAAIWLPLDMRDGWSPPSYIHELMHHWGVHLRSTWSGFITGEEGHWGHASTAGSLGGFDIRTLQTEARQPIADPMSVKPGSKVRLSEFGPRTSTCQTGYSPIELYLMGLVPKDAVPQHIYVMKNPTLVAVEEPIRTDPPSPTYQPNTHIYTLDGFTRISLDELVQLNAGEPPVATQRDFRSAWVLVTDTPASDAMILKADWYARLAGRLLEDASPTVQQQADAYIQQKIAAYEAEEGAVADLSKFSVRRKYLSFAEATGNRATLDVRCTPKPAP